MTKKTMMATAVFVCLAGSWCMGAAPAEGRFYEQYYSIYIGEVKCGWACASFSREGRTVSGRLDTMIQMARGQTAMKLVQHAETTETLDGKPLVFSYSMAMNDLKTVWQGFVDAGQVTMTITQVGQTVKHQFGIPKDAVMLWGEHLRGRQVPLKGGVTYAMKLFDPQLGPGQVMHSRVRIVGRRQMTVAGKQVRGVAAVTTIDKPLPMTMTSLLDEKGYPIVSEIPIGALRFKLVASSKAEAFKNVSTKEIFFEYMVNLERPLRSTYYRLTFTGDVPAPFDVPQTTFQKIVAKGDKEMVIELLPASAMHGLQTRPAVVPDRYLADSTYLNLTDPLLTKLAAEAIGDGGPPLVKAYKLCEFVRDYIKEKDLSIAFAPAAHVAKIRQGDCTEHAVLLAALGRIAKIPTRGVIGLVYVPTPPNGAFAYHMWTACFIDGQWIDFDGTLGRTAATGTHIALATSDLRDESFIRDAMRIIGLMGQVKIEPVARGQ